MAGFEDLIRNALAKQVNPTSDAREQVYNSARQALTRMLEGNDALSPDIIDAQRVKLEDAIGSIETGYSTEAVSTPRPSPTPPPSPSPAPAPAPMAPTAAPIVEKTAVARVGEPSIPAPVAPEVKRAVAAPVSAVPPKPVHPTPSADTPRVTPSVATNRGPAPQAAAPSPQTPQPPSSPNAEGDYPEAYIGDALREKKPYAKLLLWAIILAGLGVGGWWVYSNGKALLDQELGGGVPNPARTFESGSSEGATDDAGWITVFAPQENAQNVVTKGAGAAELQQDANRPIMRLASPDAGLNNNLLIKLPRGSMEALRGKSATFELIVRSAGEEDQSFVIFCEFASLGECGRKRFVAGSNPRPVLFDVLINDTPLGANEDAFISLNTDFDGTGRALDLYSIRMRESG